MSPQLAQHRAVGLTGDAPGLENEPATAVGQFLAIDFEHRFILFNNGKDARPLALSRAAANVSVIGKTARGWPV